MQSIYRRQLWQVAAIVLAFVFLALAGRQTQAQDAQWVGQFWNNRDLTGPVVLTRFENTIDFNWFGGSPNPLINHDNFSARWTRTVNFPAGTYRFFATMDDGMRIWIDNQLVIDSWTHSQEHTMTVDRFMNGNHAIRIDYFEAGNMAVARFNWQLLVGGGGGQFFPNWKGEYFNNTTVSGAPVFIRDDSATTHDWGLGSPGPGVNADFWSVRWTRQVSAQPGQYRIILTSDDGSRLFINNQLIIDNWRDQAATSRSADFFAPGGVFEVRIEYYDAAGAAYFRGDLISVTGGITSLTPTVPAPPTGGGACVTTPSGMQAQSIATTALNVRGGPSTQFEPISQLAPCQIVPLSGFRNSASTWVQVILPDGRTGWVSATFLHLGVPIASLTATN
jgi:hypothetical protein